MALVFRYQDNKFVCIINGIMNGYSYDKYGKCAGNGYEFSIKEKIKGMNLYAVFNKVYGRKT
jgi:hypothetical protein